MFTPPLSPAEVDYIRVSLDRCSVDEMSSELGRAKSTIKRKVREIRENDRIRRMC
nr:hypothetical protein [uncultured archaeon]